MCLCCVLQAGRRHTRVDIDISPVRMILPESKRKHAKSENGGYVNVSNHYMYSAVMASQLVFGIEASLDVSYSMFQEIQVSPKIWVA